MTGATGKSHEVELIEFCVKSHSKYDAQLNWQKPLRQIHDFVLILVHFMSKLVFITGATSGIGLASADAFWRKGFDLIITGRREDRLQQIESDFAKTKKNSLQKLHLFKLDHTDFESVEKLVSKNPNIFSQVDLLVNNAGLALGADSLSQAKWSDINTMIDTNVKGLLKVTQVVLPYMLTKKSGTIINIGSVAGRWAYPGGATYCASKAAVVSITEALRQEISGSGVRVCNIEPGLVETEFSIVRFNDKQKADQVYAGMKPLTAFDIAETVCWVFDRPAHINIQELVIFPTDQAAIRQIHRVV